MRNFILGILWLFPSFLHEWVDKLTGHVIVRYDANCIGKDASRKIVYYTIAPSSEFK